MNKSSVLSSVIVGASTVLASSMLSAANAATVGSSFTLTNFTGDEAQVSVDLTDITGGVQFAVNIDRPPTINGDLFGFFAGVKDDNVGAITSIEGDDVTGQDIAVNSVINLGGGNNLNGFKGDQFDFGVTFGSSGASNGLLSSTVFNVFGLSTLDFAGQVLGARLQSTGTSQNGSSKLVGDGDMVGGETVPEPITVLGTGAALAFGAVFRRRQKAESKDV